MKEIIKKTVEGGYSNDWGFGTERENAYSEYDWNMAIRSAVLDPLFWQALGKSLGKGVIENTTGLMWWKAQMHFFVDHLIAGKDAEEFFKDLIQNHE